MRTVPAAIAALVTQRRIRAIHILRVTIDGTTFYFAESAQTIGGHAYLPYLIFDTGPRYTLSLSNAVTAKIRLDNVDLQTVDFLTENRDNIQGSTAVLADYYMEKSAEFVLLAGTVVDVTPGDQSAVITISGFDVNATQVPVRVCSQLCTWDYKGDGCPSTSSETDCDKTLANCGVRVALQGFNGVLTITDDLTAAVQGPSTSSNLGQPGGSISTSPDPHLYLDLP